MKWVLEIKHYFLSISMFDDLDYCNMVEHRVLKILYGGFIVAKGSKMYGVAPRKKNERMT